MRKISEYFKQNGMRGESFIQRIYGLYQMKMSGVKKFYMILQRNALNVEPGNELIYKFDLKGSVYNR